jgi:phage tail tape-measure protein
LRWGEGKALMNFRILSIISALLLGGLLGCSEPLTTREKGAGVGTVAGSSLGAAIGSVSGYAGTGGIVGAVMGLGAGAMIGDHFQATEKKQTELDQKLKQCELELQRLCDDLEKLKQEIPKEEE